MFLRKVANRQTNINDENISSLAEVIQSILQSQVSACKLFSRNAICHALAMVRRLFCAVGEIWLDAAYDTVLCRGELRLHNDPTLHGGES